MKINKFILLFISMLVAFMFLIPAETQGNNNTKVLVRGTQTVFYFNTSTPVEIPTLYQEKTREMRATWVPTVFNLAGLGTANNQTQFKANFQKLISDVVDKNMNSILFQVRGNNDAWYDSDYAPWSANASGGQGISPGWDVMAWMIEYSHSQGIEFHAWLNPYRVANSSLNKETMLDSLHPTNFARQNPDLVVSGIMSSGLNPYVLNPGEPEVKTYIRNVVLELLEKYNVDGIHFDDYFYPYSGINSDTQTYDLYKKPGQTIADFRRESINDVVRGVKEDVDDVNESFNRDVRFGISPFGIWESGGVNGSNTSPSAMQSNKSQFADSRRWVLEGWVHYINPQIYWNFTHASAPYADLVDWWAKLVRGTGVDLVIGHSTANASGWLQDEISTQILYNSKHPEIKGSVFYSSASINSTNVINTKLNNWTTKTLGVWETSNIEGPRVDISGSFDGVKYSDNVMVTMTSELPIYYRFQNTDWTLYENPIQLTEEGDYVIYVRALSGTEESVTSIYTITIDKINLDLPTIEIIGDKRGDDFVSGALLNITSSSEDIWVAINYGSIGTYVLYTEPIVLEGAGNYLVKAKTINDDNVSSQEVQLAFKVVLPCFEKPTFNITGNLINSIYDEATIQLTSSASGIEYRVNGGTWTTYSNSLVFDQNGSYTFQYRNLDGCKTSTSVNFEVNQSVPEEPTITISGEKVGQFYLEEVEVSFEKALETDKVFYRFHNGTRWSSWLQYTTPIIFGVNGNFTIEYYAENAMLKRSETLSELVRINMPPSENNRFVVRDGVIVNYYQTDIPVELPTTYTEKTSEVRAVWVATVFNIDIALHQNETQYKQEIIRILNTVEANNFNTIFFQVRPMNDAFYKSDYAPFSRYLAGAEGVDPGWDVLEFFIEEAHKRGIELHAWLNPYRVSSGTGTIAEQLSLLHESNFAKQNPSYVLQDNSGRLILNPGQPEVRVYLKNVIDELMTNYNLDGIHFDDYFYSYNGMSNTQDALTFQNYNENNLSLSDWRRDNVNVLVRDIFNLVEAHNQSEDVHVKFGISPFGIWKSGGTDGSNTSTSTLQSYHGQFADTKKWIEEGWIHYVIPQLYWEFSHRLAPYADLVKWWAELTEQHGVDLIIGHGLYRFVDDSWTDANEFTEQIRYMSTFDSVVGSAIFSYRTLNSQQANVVQTMSRLNNYFWTSYTTFPWESDVTRLEAITCEEGYEEIEGTCVRVIVTCEEGYALVDGKCEIITEIPVECGMNEVLVGESCQPKEIENDQAMSQGLMIGLITGASVIVLGGAFITLKKFGFIKK